MGRVTTEKPLQLRVFDAVFTKRSEDWDLNKEVFSQMMYPVTEKCAIMFPEYAMLMAQKYVSGYNAAICFNNLFDRKYNLRFQSSWMRHSRPKVEPKTKEKVEPLFDENIIRGYCSKYNIDYHSAIEAIERFPEEMKIELKEYKTDFIDNASNDDVEDNEDF